MGPVNIFCPSFVRQSGNRFLWAVYDEDEVTFGIKLCNKTTQFMNYKTEKNYITSRKNIISQ